MQQSLYGYLKEWLRLVFRFIKVHFLALEEKNLTIIALMSQLALYDHEVKSKKRSKPVITPAFRQLWVLFSNLLPDWKSILIPVKPETVLKWHRSAFKLHWFLKSKKKGRPKISKETISLIRRIYKENPLLSPEKIYEKLVLLGIENPPAPNTITKYIPSIRKPPSEKQVQSWKTFIKNHKYNTWSTDFFTIPTLRFEILYVLIIIHHQSRRILHFGVTRNPSADWTVQQFRHATPYGEAPKYLIHDNDSIFRSTVFQRFLSSSHIKSKRTAFKSPWQNPYAERVIGTIRQDLLNHIIPLDESHLHKLLREYIHDYYNTHRTHQGIEGKTPIPAPKYFKTLVRETNLIAKPVLNGLYHTYQKVA